MLLVQWSIRLRVSEGMWCLVFKISRVSEMGILVKSDTISKLTRMSFSDMEKFWRMLMKCDEFRTYEEAFSANGCRILERCFARAWVGDLMELTIGRSGMLVLWILGRPYILGMRDDFSRGMILLLISAGMLDLCISSLVFFSRYVVGLVLMGR